MTFNMDAIVALLKLVKSISVWNGLSEPTESLHRTIYHLVGSDFMSSLSIS